MAKINNRIRSEILALSVVGLSQSAIAEKYNISQKTVSLILKDEKNAKKVSKAKESIEKGIEEEKKTLKNKAHDAIIQIIDDLCNDLKNASLRDKMATLEKLIDRFGLPEEAETEEVTEILVEIEDASGGDDEKND